LLRAGVARAAPSRRGGTSVAPRLGHLEQSRSIARFTGISTHEGELTFMKKIIATACVSAIFGFVVALANAEDTTSASDTSDSSMSQQAGQAANPNDSSAPFSHESSTTTTTTSKWKDTKTCTDSDGVTYYRGKKGYKHCVTAQAAKKNAKKEQMSGTVGNENQHDSSMKSGTDSDTNNMLDHTSDKPMDSGDMDKNK
jgi:hypothetical protein